jgi:hypothetical protein
MPVTPFPQSAFAADGPVTVTLKSDPKNGRGLMRMLVNDEERAFHLFPNQPKAETQEVHVFGFERAVTILAGWGTAADRGKTLTVKVDDAQGSVTIP